MSARPQIVTTGFEDAARLIAADEKDVVWLADGLRYWIWPQERWPAHAREKYGPGLGMFADFARMRRGRAKVVRALNKTLPDAIAKVVAVTGDWTLRQFIFDSALGPGLAPVQHVHLLQLLREVSRRSLEASRSPEIAASEGKAKAGRGKALAPSQVDEMAACAATVMVAWKTVRGGEAVGPQTKAAAEAAAILFALGSAPAGQFDQVKPRKKHGGDPVKTWQPHFAEAALPNPALERLNAMLEADLQVIRKWHLEHRSGGAAS